MILHGLAAGYRPLCRAVARLYVLSDQKPQHVRAVVREVTNNDYCTGQNDCRVPARKTNLHITKCPAKVNDRSSQTVNQTIDHSEIENLPQPFARRNMNRIDN